MMFARAVLAFLALPGVIAGVVPWVLVRVDPWRSGGSALGAAVLGAGLVILLWCVRDFYVAGKGTLAPWSPPKDLVVVGLYRYARNPMYVGVLAIVGGTALWAGSPVVALYLVLLAVGFHLRVVTYEEPWLAKQFGERWARYSRDVPRWWPRPTPWRGA